MKVWLVMIEQYDDGELEGYEVVPYDNEQTARQHVDRANKSGWQHARVRPTEILSKLRSY